MTMTSYTLITMSLLLSVQVLLASLAGSELINTEINQSKLETALSRSPRKKEIVEKFEQETFSRNTHTKNLTDRTTNQKAPNGRENIHPIITRRAMDKKLDGIIGFHAQGRFSGRKRNFRQNNNVARREFSGEKLNNVPEKESEEQKFSSRNSETDVAYINQMKSGETKRQAKGFNFNGGGENTADEGDQWRFGGRKKETEGDQWRFGGRKRDTEGDQWRFGGRKRETEGDQWRFGGRKRDTEGDQWRFGGRKRGNEGEDVDQWRFGGRKWENEDVWRFGGKGHLGE